MQLHLFRPWPPPAAIEERIRELKSLLKSYGPLLEFNKQLSRRTVFYGKPDRKRKAFRDYEERKSAYLSSLAEHRALRQELCDLQALARSRQNR